MKRILQALVVSSNPAQSRQLAEEITAAGHEVKIAAAPYFQQIRQEQPDLLLLDLSENEAGGLELLKRLVRHHLTARTAVIVFSPRPELEYELPDAFDFLLHPLDQERLRADLELLAGRSTGRIQVAERLPADEAPFFQEFIERQTGLHFDQRNLRQLERGLRRRLQAVQARDFTEYRQYLEAHRENRGELKKLLSLLTVGETYFFRYRSDRDALVQHVLPELIRRRQAERTLRLWSAGCSTGEEPYSVAILLLEHFPELRDWRIELLATDINKRSLRHARQGVYATHSLRLTAGPYREKYFREIGEGLYQLDSQVRRLVHFSYLNLQDETYPSIMAGSAGVDLIFCRNVLIYFRRETIRRVIERFHTCLRPEGFLFLGHAETLAGFSDLFVRHHQQGAFFYQSVGAGQEKGGLRREVAATSLPLATQKPTAADSRPKPASRQRKPELFPPESCSKLEEVLEAARLAFDREEFARAEFLYGEILQRDPRHVGALVRMGLIQANRGAYAEARQFCARAIRQNDLCPEAYLLRGLILDMEGETERAMVEYQKVLWLDQEFTVARFYLAKAFCRLERQSEAAREFRTILRQLERHPKEIGIPFSGGFSREVFLELVREDLARLPAYSTRS